MKTYTVRKYAQSDKPLWNAFVKKAKNATFLFQRDFMDYHSDRFADFSLMVFDGDSLAAVIPAHLDGTVLYSHRGLTYGGIAIDDSMKLASFLSLFHQVLEFLNRNDIAKFYIKTIPPIYHKLPSDELLYALFVADSKLVRRDSLSVLDLQLPAQITKARRESIRRGAKNGLIINEEPKFADFWNLILIPNLQKKHAAKPVHSLAEIELLHSRFPENIRHFNVYDNGQLVAGTTVFVSDKVAHPQYISGNPDKNALGSLDFLYHFLIADVFADKRYFDFGISNENNGNYLNEKLLFWKESFGARTVAHDFYEVETANYKRLETVLI